jgi:rhamnosyltransferase
MSFDKNNRHSDNKIEKQHVFIIGSKGIPASYGGFETFVENLTLYRKSDDIVYHVACMSNRSGSFIYNKAECFNIHVPHIGAAKAIYYDIFALKHCIKYIKNNHIENPIIYILACRIGPFIAHYKKQIDKLGGKLYVNPDGHEWMRAKWNKVVRRYWKYSERLMVKSADLLICDSKNIEKYIHEEYGQYDPSTTFIAYGSETSASKLDDQDIKFIQWMNDKDLKSNNYYLIVGRFVPENNFETIIREFMKSHTSRSLAIITTANDKFLRELEAKLHFENDPRIKFVGTVYNKELLKKIRENAYGYIHGHSVGGTNPSLLEALGLTKLNLLLDVGFNKEVGEDSAFYWSRDEGSLSSLIDSVDLLDEETRNQYGKKAKHRIATAYSWNYIIDCYESVFLKDE